MLLPGRRCAPGRLLNCVLAGLDPPPRILFEDALYLAGRAAALSCVACANSMSVRARSW